MHITIEGAGRLVIPKALREQLERDRAPAGLLFVYATFSDRRRSDAADLRAAFITPSLG